MLGLDVLNRLTLKRIGLGKQSVTKIALDGRLRSAILGILAAAAAAAAALAAAMRVAAVAALAAATAAAAAECWNERRRQRPSRRRRDNAAAAAAAGSISIATSASRLSLHSGSAARQAVADSARRRNKSIKPINITNKQIKTISRLLFLSALPCVVRFTTSEVRLSNCRLTDCR